VKGDVCLELPPLLTRTGIDLLVMGTQGRRNALADFLVRPLVETLMNRMPCSLLVAKPEGRSGISPQD
jgi:nucleotide-binding universal stress UspA family protein